MVKLSVRYLVSVPGRNGGLPHYYWQPSGKLRAQGFRSQRVPLHWGDFTDPATLHAAAIARAQELNAEMDAQLAIAAVGRTRTLPGKPAAQRTLGDLIRAYTTSDHFQRLAPATQRGYRQCLLKIEDWGADAPLRAIDPVRVQRFYASMARTPAFGAAVIRVLRLLFEHGIRTTNWVTSNPATRPGLTGSEPSGLIWPREAVLAFVAAADAMGRPSMGTAVLLNEWLGQREGDILRMPRTVLRGAGADRRLVLRQSKTGAGVQLPIGLVPHLAERLAAELARIAEAPATTIIISETTRAPYVADNFRHVFAQVRSRVAKTTPAFEIDHLMPGRDMADPKAFQVRMQDLTFMQLRHTAVTRLAEAGCDTPLIASITGHSQDTVVALMRRYMVRTGELARQAFQRRLDAEAVAVSIKGAG